MSSGSASFSFLRNSNSFRPVFCLNTRTGCVWTEHLQVWRGQREQSGDSHELVVPDDLDRHVLAGSGGVPGSDHVAEDALTRVPVHVVALVQNLSDVHS